MRKPLQLGDFLGQRRLGLAVLGAVFSRVEPGHGKGDADIHLADRLGAGVVLLAIDAQGRIGHPRAMRQLHAGLRGVDTLLRDADLWPVRQCQSVQPLRRRQVRVGGVLRAVERRLAQRRTGRTVEQHVEGALGIVAGALEIRPRFHEPRALHGGREHVRLGLACRLRSGRGLNSRPRPAVFRFPRLRSSCA